MILDILAGLLLLALWLFGGAALLFDSYQEEYKDVLLGWSLLNALAVGATLLCCAAFWALERLCT